MHRLCFFLNRFYHNVISKYLPKLYHFDFDRVEIGALLAALDNNKNTGREQKRSIIHSENGAIKIKSHFRVAYRKPMKKFIARKFYEKKDYVYLKEMMQKVRAKSAVEKPTKRASKRKIMAPKERDSRREMINRSITFCRFK